MAPSTVTRASAFESRAVGLPERPAHSPLGLPVGPAQPGPPAPLSRAHLPSGGVPPSASPRRVKALNDPAREVVRSVTCGRLLSCFATNTYWFLGSRREVSVACTALVGGLEGLQPRCCCCCCCWHWASPWWALKEAPPRWRLVQGHKMVPDVG